MRWVLCVGLLLYAAGCGSDGLKYPDDHVRFERIVEAVEALRSAYEQQDLKALQALRLPVKNLDRFERDAQKDFSAFATIALALTIERMYIRGERATVNVRWEGEWQRAPEDTLVTDRGHGVLVWSGRQVVLLATVEGNLPFGVADRYAASSPER